MRSIETDEKLLLFDLRMLRVSLWKHREGCRWFLYPFDQVDWENSIVAKCSSHRRRYGKKPSDAADP